MPRRSDSTGIPDRPTPLIDLHMHTTASDGADAPGVLVSKCEAAGLTVIAVTDHDTIDAIAAAEEAAVGSAVSVVPGIEITAVWHERDVHVLGYFIDYRAPVLTTFLAAQREDRIRRARVIGQRLAAMNAPIDIEQVIARAGRTPVSRPSIAQALVEAGHAEHRGDAFDRYVGEGCEAFAPRVGTSIGDAIEIIRQAGGLASLAHPGLTGIDDLIPALANAGLGALEVYHVDHTDADTVRYHALAHQLGLGITGGSDYHGDESHHPGGLGRFVTPRGDFDDLRRRAGSS